MWTPTEDLNAPRKVREWGGWNESYRRLFYHNANSPSLGSVSRKDVNNIDTGHHIYFRVHFKGSLHNLRISVCIHKTWTSNYTYKVKNSIYIINYTVSWKFRFMINKVKYLRPSSFHVKLLFNYDTRYNPVEICERNWK